MINNYVSQHAASSGYVYIEFQYNESISRYLIITDGFFADERGLYYRFPQSFPIGNV